MANGLEASILNELRNAETMSKLLSLSQICTALGVIRGRNGCYSRTASAKYHASFTALQRLKHAGKVEYIRHGGGWQRLNGERP